MAVQQSGFTIHGGPTALERQPSSDQYLRRFLIRTKNKEAFRKELWLLGIRRSMLFPDIENLAKELAFEWRHKGQRGRDA
jgi:hypothetical protein